MSFISNEREKHSIDNVWRIQVRKTMMMNKDSATKDFGDHHVGPIEKLAMASGEREI